MKFQYFITRNHRILNAVADKGQKICHNPFLEIFPLSEFRFRTENVCLLPVIIGCLPNNFKKISYTESHQFPLLHKKASAFGDEILAANMERTLRALESVEQYLPCLGGNFQYTPFLIKFLLQFF